MSGRREGRVRPDSEVAVDHEIRESPLEVRPPTADALCIETPLWALEQPVTPTGQFFVRNHFAVPHVDLSTWRLVVEGEVDHPLILTYDEIREMAHRETEALLECAGNSRATVRPRAEGVLWRNGAVGTARWSGVPLAEILSRARVRPGAVEVMLEGADHGHEPGVAGELSFAMSLTVEKALDPDTLLADEMNGAPLSPRHGFPVRAVVPGWYGMASVKWLSRIVVLDRPFEGYYKTLAYAIIPEGDSLHSRKRPVTTVRVKSLVTWPKEGQRLPLGTHRIKGVAWSGSAPIERVEVSIGGQSVSGDEDPWHAATLSRPPAPHAWTHWQYECELTQPGFYVIRARAVDTRGNTQPVQAKWNFRGLATNSIHAVPVEVGDRDRRSEPHAP
jgi:DMSO/TMAO reductase YedYZ molybdopterin-dependent catalytic subunit